MKSFVTSVSLCLVAIITLSSAFVLPDSSRQNVLAPKQQYNVNSFQRVNIIDGENSRHLPAFQEQRKSTTKVMSLFGLGGAEIVVIMVLGVFLLGPEKLAQLGRKAGEMSTDFKDVPKEFQKGLEEGETEVRARKAKQMDKVDDESS